MQRRPRRQGGRIARRRANQGAAGAWRGTGNRIGPKLIRLREAPRPADRSVFDVLPGLPALARTGALWQGSARLEGPLGRFSYPGQCCRSSVVEHSIGNGEVDSSILSGSTSLSLENPSNRHKSAFLPDRRFPPFRPEKTRKACVNGHKTGAAVHILSGLVPRPNGIDSGVARCGETGPPRRRTMSI
jgi:hypothetical protein